MDSLANNSANIYTPSVIQGPLNFMLRVFLKIPIYYEPPLTLKGLARVNAAKH
jgi:hypothetical protein